MIDYSALQALAEVIRHQSFEKAAQSLGLTQSAVSQRISGLERDHGEKLLVRKQPYRATSKGELLLGLLHKVRLLESQYVESFDDQGRLPQVKIAMNRDSLELWFDRFLATSEFADRIRLEIVADDQDLTLNYLRSGQADIAISNQSQALPNYESELLGRMAYVIVATPQFKDRYFSRGLSEAALRQAPAVLFDDKDGLHKRFLESSYQFTSPFPFHLIPSIKGFRYAILSGYGYGLIPMMDVKEDLIQV